MGKLIKAAILLLLLGGIGGYVLIRQFAPGNTPAEKVENTRQELRNVREMVEAALPKAPPGPEGTGLSTILGGNARPEGAALGAREVDAMVEARPARPSPAAASPHAPPAPGRTDTEPASANAGKPPGLPAPETPAQKLHVVAAGETLNLIASRYFGSAGAWKRIADANPGVDPDRLRVGAKLVIPAEAPPAAAPPEAAPSVPATRDPSKPGARYKVQAGDTLSGIARRVLGDENRWKEIVKANPELDPDRLSVGQEIVLPADAGKR